MIELIKSLLIPRRPLHWPVSSPVRHLWNSAVISFSEHLHQLTDKKSIWVYDMANHSARMPSKRISGFSGPQKHKHIATLLQLSNKNSTTASNIEIGWHYLKSKIIEDISQFATCMYPSLSKTLKRYAVIQKEVQAATWASETFSDYVLGLSLVLETGHKPLTTLLNLTELSKMLPE